MPCKFCYRDEPRCDPENLILCSRCFMVVADSTQEQIKRAHVLAIEKDYPQKAAVLKKFILKEDIENDGLQINARRKPRHTAKHLDRGRGPKVNRIEKITINRLPQPQEASSSANQPELQAVPRAGYC